MRILVAIPIVLALAAGLNAVGRFADNGDGTVKDAKTGLVWMKCSAGQNVPDCSGKVVEMDWHSSFKFCDSLALSGKKWRLPTVDELQTILDRSRFNPAIDAAVFPIKTAALKTMAKTAPAVSDYWSSTIHAFNPIFAWEVSFYDGSVFYIDIANGNYVRCVAEGQ